MSVLKRTKGVRKRRKSGFTYEEIAQKLAKQEYRCAICLCPLTFDTAVGDHDHRTGKHRGLLCTLCNTGLGMFRDAASVLEYAAKYLREHGLD